VGAIRDVWDKGVIEACIVEEVRARILKQVLPGGYLKKSRSMVDLVWLSSVRSRGVGIGGVQ